MIIIIRALSQVRYKKGHKKGEGPPKEEKGHKKEKAQKMREKERRGNVTILLPHLCFKVAPCSSCSESHILCFKVAPCSSYRLSPMLSLSYTSGNFHYRTWLAYSNDGLPQMP